MKQILILTILLALCSQSYALIFTQPDLPADYGIIESPLTSDLSGTTSSSSVLAGAFGSNGQNGVYVFALPVIGSGFIVQTASLQFTYLGAGTNDTSNARVDLWGIGFQNTTTPILEYLETDTDLSAGNLKIQNDIVTPSTQPGEIATNSAGNGLLSSYLQIFYDVNPSYAGGSFVFLRLNPDADVTTTGTSQGYRFEVAENSSQDPTLTINAIPEPSVLFLLIISLPIALYIHRRLTRRCSESSGRVT